MDPLKEAFQKIKEDILSLKNDLSTVRSEISMMKSLFDNMKDNNTQTDRYSDTNREVVSSKKGSFSNLPNNQTTQTGFTRESGVQTDKQTDKPTDFSENTTLEHPYTTKTQFSIGNHGVQTDKQTDRRVDSHMLPQGEYNKENEQQYTNAGNLYDTVSKFEKVNEILASLNDVKKEIRHKFKSLTPQEMLIFSTLYTLEDQNIDEIGYFILADAINLTESSIRDYINKLIKKGIPIDKTRLNNKKIILKISPNLRKIATLPTIMKLRNL